jgi:hypothetical protein
MRGEGGEFTRARRHVRRSAGVKEPFTTGSQLPEEEVGHGGEELRIQL